MLRPAPLLAALVLLSSPPSGAPVPAPTGEDRVTDSIDWFRGTWTACLARAAAESRPVFLYVWADGSPQCVRVYTETLVTDEAAAALADFLCYGADAVEPAGARLVQRFGVTTLPTMLVLLPDGSVEEAILGFVPLAAFVAELDRIRAGRGTVSELRAKLAAAPDDLQLRFDLARKLGQVGALAERDELLASIRRDDPKRETEVGARLALQDVVDAVTAEASDPGDYATFDLDPVYAHVRRIDPPTVAFGGWEWLADAELARGRRAEARGAWIEAWPLAPEARRVEWGGGVARTFWDMRDELTRSERRFALRVALEASERALEDYEAELADREAEGEDAGEPPPEEQRSPRRLAASQLETLACCYHMNGKRSKALEALRRSLELEPGDPARTALLQRFEGD